MTVAFSLALAVCLISFVGASNGGDAPSNTAPPQIVKTLPAVGATDVSAGLSEIIVIFDQDMSPGYSWMSGPYFPEVTGKPLWRDKRTCALPVKLARGRFYRIGINSSDPEFQNFANEDGMPALPCVLWFVTEGATNDEKAKAIAPRVVATVPANGARDVDPALPAIEVTFDKQMSAGMSWTDTGGEFPRASGPAYWKDDRRTCIFPVRLQPGRTYEVGINGLWNINFQSAEGVPAAPTVLRFKTGAEKQAPHQ